MGKIHFVLVADFIEHCAEFVLKLGEPGVGFQVQPLVFATAPQDFNAIEFGAVRREVKQGTLPYYFC